ncbi:hypothetical protein WJX82_001006 [Trebouxia sp. C0006]
MARLLKLLDPTISAYFDRRFPSSTGAGEQQKRNEFEEALRTSTTVYIGNLAFTTSDFQLYELFSKAGDIKRLIMGLDATKKTPCGFCFVSYFTRKDAEAAVKYINGSMMDGRSIRVDHDWGFVEGRQFGRGRSGGQVRDEHRTDYDQGRGGYGQLMWQEIETRQMAAVGQAEFDSNPVYNRQDSNRGRKRQQRENDTYQQQSRNPRARDDDDD